jgi:hypothetical protein
VQCHGHHQQVRLHPERVAGWASAKHRRYAAGKIGGHGRVDLGASQCGYGQYPATLRCVSRQSLMWARNLLFLAVCGIGAAWTASTLMQPASRFVHFSEAPPSGKPARSEGQPAARRHRDDAWQQALAQLDAEFYKAWADAGLTHAPRADDLTIARRLSLALVGTIPSLEEIRALEAWPEDERLPRWVDHLLADRRFAEYWSERLARAYVGSEQGNIVLFRRRRFRLWLADALAKNMPYDELVRHLLADEGVWTGQPAVNFITATINPAGGNEPDPVRLAGRTARAFLGMRIDCLQCHDDKLGTIELGTADDPQGGTQAHFHELAAFFASAQISLVGVRDGQHPYLVKYQGDAQERKVAPQVPFGKEFFEGHGTHRAQLARWVTHPQNRAFARATVNRVWALLFGRPLVEPVDDIPLHGPWPVGLEFLADEFVRSGYDLARLIRLIAASAPMLRDSRADFPITPEHEAAWAVFPLSRLRPEQMAAALVQASWLKTIDGQAHVLQRLAMAGQIDQFVRRYGDLGDDEFNDQASTIPQRLLLMNGELVKERTRPQPLVTATSRLAMLSRDPQRQVEAAYLAVLTRRPTPTEWAHFVTRLHDVSPRQRGQALEDLYWTLVNSSEFSWNH